MSSTIGAATNKRVLSARGRADKLTVSPRQKLLPIRRRMLEAKIVLSHVMQLDRF